MNREQLDKHAARMRRENTEHTTKSDAAIGGWRKRRSRQAFSAAMSARLSRHWKKRDADLEFQIGKGRIGDHDADDVASYFELAELEHKRTPTLDEQERHVR